MTEIQAQLFRAAFLQSPRQHNHLWDPAAAPLFTYDASKMNVFAWNMGNGIVKIAEQCK